MRYQTEKYDFGHGGGQIGPTYDTFEAAQQWCHDECKHDSLFVNKGCIYAIHDADKDWRTPDIYVCIWNCVEECIEDITEIWNKTN